MRWNFLYALLFMVSLGYGQDVPSSPEEIEKQYNANIKKSRIDGVYIPKNIDEGILEIIDLSPPESLQKFKAAEESFVVKRLHFGLGKWIANKWNFHEGSRYAHYLRMQGVSYPDDMIDVTLTALHRYLNSKELGLEEYIAKIKAKRKAEHDSRLKSGQLIESSVTKIDSLK